MSMVPCPNNGKCGSRNHRVGSAAYKRCVQGSTGDARKSPFMHLTNTPPSINSDNDIMLDGMTRRLKWYGAVHIQADSPVFSEVSLNSSQVQDYIDNPQNVSFNDKQEGLINEGIRRNIEDIAGDAGIDIDELSPKEFDIVCQAARKAMNRIDALNCVAEKMGPRTFSTPVSLPRKKMALQEANEQFDFGTDGWFESVAYRYWIDMVGKDGRLDDPGRRSIDGWSSVKYRIEEAIREAVTKRGVVVESADDLPDFSVVWTSTLDDISPAINKERSVEIGYPYLVATYSDTGAVGEPVKLNAGYRIGYEEIPSFIGDPRISVSPIVDERTSDNGVLNLSGKDAMAEYPASLSTL